MRREICKDCTYFVQHFVETENGFIPCGSGHCIRMRLRIRKTDHKPCESFSPRELQLP